jgi:PAS domain S-box-containing protein
MNLAEQSSRTKSVEPPVPGARGISALLGSGHDAHRDSRRIAVGLVGLAVISLVLLNFGIYQSAEQRLVKQRWSQLQGKTEERRDEVRSLLDRYQREAAFAAGGSTLIDAARSALMGPLQDEDRAVLSAEMDRAIHNLEFDSALLVAPDGTTLAGTAGAGTEDVPRLRELVRRALDSGAPALGSLHRDRDSGELLAVAVPMVRAALDDKTPVLVLAVDVDVAMHAVLRYWPGFGAAAGAYLVEQEGDQLVMLTSVPNHAGDGIMRRVPAVDPAFRAAAMAAVGVESHVEVPGAHGPTTWAVTRFLPEVGWGLVGQDDRSAIDDGMRGTLVGLLMLDVAIAVLAMAALWLWRRQYATGLAEREVEVTRRHAERVQSVLDTALDAIVGVDHVGRIVEFNPSAERIFGYTRQQALGRGMSELLAPEMLDARDENGFASSLVRGRGTMLGQRLERSARRADGTEFPIEISLSRMPNVEPPMFTAFIRDIGERVEAEARVRSFAEGLELSNRRLAEVNAQLDEASRLKSEFLANTSHELRTPLNGMIGFLQLVLDNMCDSPEEERDFLKQALQCSRHLLGLINDVLDIAKIEAGKLTLDIEPIDVEQLFHEVYTLTHVQAAQKGITLRFTPPASDDLRARGDFGKIKQVLVNLVGNSLKFTPSGSISVRATQHPDSGHFMFEVQDTGIGISPERQKLVFEKFTQADGSTTRKYGGTGLGLAISRSLVELMGGIIGVHSDGEGKGTRMYFSLPVWREAVQDDLSEATELLDRIEGPATGPLVLIVEDDTTFRHYLSTLLHAHGYRTVQARHAEGGWVQVRRLQPSVVVLDYALGCNEGAHLRTGWDLAERMTTDNATRHIPLIFVTGFDDELREKLKATAFARKPLHLMKPIDGEALIAKIGDVIGHVQNRKVRVLMADDDPSVAAYVKKVLPDKRFHLEIATNGEECLHILRTQPRGFDVLLLDLMMPQVSGYDVLREMTLTGMNPELPVLVLTNFPEARNEDERRLLDDGLVLEVLPKLAVHDNPQLLPHIIEWQMQVAREGAEAAGPKPAVGDAPRGDEPDRRAA